MNEKYELKGAETIRRFITGGRAIVTLTSPTTKSYTYLIKTPANESQFDAGTLFVYVITHNKQWFYVGMITPQFEFKLTFHSNWSDSHEITKGFRYIMNMAKTDGEWKMKLYHVGRCARCGRKLTDYKSIMAGMGPKCRQQHEHNIRQRALQGFNEENR